MNTENNKKNEPHKFVYNLLQILDLTRSNKNVAQNNSSNVEWWVWTTWRFLFGVRYSRLYQLHLKNYETLQTNPPIHININRINDLLVLKIKDRYKLELQTPETTKLFGSTKKLIG